VGCCWPGVLHPPTTPDDGLLCGWRQECRVHPYQQAHKYETGINRISAGRLHQLARALGVEPGYFFEGLGSGERPRPTARQRQMIELARSFAALPQPQQEALCGLARALAGTEAPAEAEEEAEETARDAA